MSKEKTKNQLRLWPGILIVVLQWIVWYLLPLMIPEDSIITMGVLGGLAGGLFLLVWWAFFSRARQVDRWTAILLMVASLAGTTFIAHDSIMEGYQGMMFYTFAVPVLSLAFIVWAFSSKYIAEKYVRLSMVATIIIACLVWTLFRSTGITADAGVDFTWRWAASPENQLLDTDEEEMLVLPPATMDMDTTIYWPGYRGKHRDGVVPGIRISTDWKSSPPVELWRRPIGPGCSSFAIRGNLFYTQEQRGDHEMVSCYALDSGKPVWRHKDRVRFWDSHAGAGPRSTPTLHGNRIYTVGATGILNALDARDGSLIWSRNISDDTKAKDSGWGFTSSPLVFDSLVIVAATGKLAAYNLSSGAVQWYGPDGGDSYSSPHLITLEGEKQVLLMNASGAISVRPFDGKKIWQHSWPCESRIVQPAITADGDLLFSAGEKRGMHRISIQPGTDNWKIEQRWTTTGLRPDFNDFVIHKDHVYGFLGPRLACINLSDGNQQWKGPRYGGQLLLLPEQDLMLILSEKGELVLAGAKSDGYNEYARIKAIEGKTWNHPAIAGDILLLRNTNEMVAYRLSPSDT